MCLRASLQYHGNFCSRACESGAPHTRFAGLVRREERMGHSLAFVHGFDTKGAVQDMLPPSHPAVISREDVLPSPGLKRRRFQDVDTACR